MRKKHNPALPFLKKPLNNCWSVAAFFLSPRCTSTHCHTLYWENFIYEKEVTCTKQLLSPCRSLSIFHGSRAKRWRPVLFSPRNNTELLDREVTQRRCDGGTITRSLLVPQLWASQGQLWGVREGARGGGHGVDEELLPSAIQGYIDTEMLKKIVHPTPSWPG